MKPFSILTSNISQTFFLGFSLLAVIAFSFYVGAKFGNQFIGHDGVSSSPSQSILPPDITDQEIVALTKEIGPIEYHFHDYLEKQDLDLKKIISKKNKVEKSKNKDKKKKKPEVIVKNNHKNKNQNKKKIEKNDEKKILPVEEVEMSSGDLLADLLKEDLDTKKYTLVLGSFNLNDDATNMKRKFKENGYSVWIEDIIQANGRKNYEVRIGRYDSKDAAQVGAKRMKKIFGITPVISSM